MYHLLPSKPMLAALTSPFIYNTFVWMNALRLKDNSIVDIAWSLLFLFPNLILIQWTGNWNPKTTLMMGALMVWATRLSYHIYMRHTGVEDFRYQAMRKRWIE